MSGHKYLEWLGSQTQGIYWHDSAVRSEQIKAFGDGAAGMTTNPFLIYSALHGDPKFWEDKLSCLPEGLKGDEKVKALIHTVAGFYAKEIQPVYDKGVPGKGYVCAQTNPMKTGDAEYMIEQAKEFAAWAPNIVVKVPATNAGLKAYEECVAMGLNMASTVSFTVSQVLAAGEAAERGKRRALEKGIKPGLTIAVLMAGRLDDYLRDVAHDSCAEVMESDIVQAGLACLKKAYKIFVERGYSTYLMPAGLRGINQVMELAGARMIFSLAPKIIKLLPEDTPCEERISVPVAADVLERLMTMQEFRKAYETDGMKREEFITFGSANRTTDQFINDGWNQLASYEYRK